MQVQKIIDLGKYRIVDLSKECVPGKTARRLEIRRKIIEYDNTLMHEIDMVSHIGTHVEAPSHYLPTLKDVTALPVKTFMGDAAFITLAHLELGQEITPVDFQKEGEIRDGDILIIRTLYRNVPENKLPYLSIEAAKWMVKRRVKMLAIDTETVGVEKPGSKAPRDLPVHETLLQNDIPIIEGLNNLDRLKSKRCFFIALPLKITGLDASMVRAIALEER